MKITNRIEVTIECDGDRCSKHCEFLEEFLSYTGKECHQCHLYVRKIGETMKRFSGCVEDFPIGNTTNE